MIRDARPEDLPAIARLHADSWRATYRGTLPDAFLDDAADTYMADRWKDQPQPGWLLRVFEDADRVEGFANICLDRGDTPYLHNLHVAVRAQGRGIGRRLLRDCARQLRAQDRDSLYLVVLRDNTGARAMYRKLGGAEGAVFDDPFGESVVKSLPVRWESLAPLLK